MKVTTENYYSQEVQERYITGSQIKSFLGSAARPGCPSAALARIKGLYKPPETEAQLVGKYVDAYFEGSLEKFKESHPQIFKKDGELYAKFEHANTVIKYGQNDSLFMKYIKGESQVIVTGEIYGFPMLGRLDFTEKASLTDLKCMADMEPVWCGSYGKLNFIDAWGYMEQLAIYQELERQRTGIKKPTFLAVLTKENQPNKEIIYLPDEKLEIALEGIKHKLSQVFDIKTGKEPAIRCEKCDWCKSTKKLTEPVHYNDLL